MPTGVAQYPASGPGVVQLSQVAALPNRAGRPAVPELASFVAPFVNGDANVLRAAYANGLFALPVVHQTCSTAGYVSSDDNTLTQFQLAAQFGTVGLLAHNYESGQVFFQLLPGQNIQLIYGDGRIASYWVTHI